MVKARVRPGPGQGSGGPRMDQSRVGPETFWKQSLEWCGQLVQGQPAPGCTCPQAVVGGWVGDDGYASC
jgi:hypothetical protein